MYCKTSEVSSELRATVSLQDISGTITTCVIDVFVLRNLLHVPKETTVEPDTLVAKVFAEEEANVLCQQNLCV